MSTTIEKITARAHEQKKFKNGCAWINNHYLPIEDAGVPIMDVGFSKSDCTYDVVATWKGKFFKLDEHLDRFEENWKKLRLKPPVNKLQMKARIIFPSFQMKAWKYVNYINEFISADLSLDIII